MKKVLKLILTAVLVILVVFLVARNVIVKRVLETSISAVTGFSTKVGKINIDFPGKVHVQDLKIHNPKGFERDIFVEIPEFYVSAALGPILRQEKIYLHELRLNLAQVNIEKNKEGISNVGLLSSVGAAKGEKPKPAPQKGKAMPFYLERLVLSIGKTSYMDKSGPIPQNLSVDMKVENQVFEKIQDPGALVNLILLKILYGATFGNLGINPEQLQATVADIKSKGQELLTEGQKLVSEKAGEMAAQTKEVVSEKTDQLAQEARQALEGVSGTVGDAADEAKSKLSGFMGKLKSQVTQEQ
ncbi:MAG: apolipoprotein A1/A4/E family protein [Candidatus Omnitrophica bacterium]|nr:apolipoprotein A1/A4/E family protein [Candidatus Omnitrophota bacterium]